LKNHIIPYILFSLFLVITACSLSETDRQKVDQMNQAMPNQTADSVEIIHSEEGLIKVKIKAPKLIMRDDAEDQFSEFPEGVVIDFFDDNGEKTADLSALYGRENPRKKERIVRDSVVINTVDNKVIETGELYMNDQADSISNNGQFVKITTPTQLIQGYGLEADSRFTNIRINDIFNSEILVEEEKTNTTARPRE